MEHSYAKFETLEWMKYLLIWLLVFSMNDKFSIVQVSHLLILAVIAPFWKFR